MAFLPVDMLSWLPIAQQAADTEKQLPEEIRSRVSAMVMLVLLLGILGIVIILLLGVSWRRYNKRISGDAEKQAKEAPDPWTTSAQRAKLEDDADQGEDDSDADEGDDDNDDDDPDKPRGRGPESGKDGPPPVGV